MTQQPTQRLHCPSCGSPDLDTLENILGVGLTNGMFRGPLGLDIEFAGETKVDYDSSETVGVICRACRWLYEGDDFDTKLITDPSQAAQQAESTATPD